VAEFIGKMNLLPAEVEADGDRIVVDVAGLGRGQVVAEQAPGGVIAGRSTVGIRPETLSILFAGESTDRRVANGVVDEVVYYGDMTYYDVRVPGIEQPLTISMKNLIGRPVLEVGTPTQVVWDERSLVVLSR
jgi:spermidine/putrescine transport system ATP-binding protein